MAWRRAESRGSARRMFRGGIRPGRRFRIARRWSNRVLREIAPLFDGDVINVSGWQDGDKEGGRYRDYFRNARSYMITNYGGYRGEGRQTELILDLEAELPGEMVARADVVYNHTTLEHVFEVFTGVANLCRMTRDVVIVVVPAIQEEHAAESFGDYWRFTSGGLRRLFESNGLTPVFLGSSPYRDCAVYHLCVASRHPDRWRGRVPQHAAIVNTGSDMFRESLLERFIHRLRTRQLGEE
jgi:hypothetical protein